MIIYDMLGSMIQTLPDLSSPVLIDVHYLKNGLYFFTLIEEGNKSVIKGKFMVQK